MTTPVRIKTLTTPTLTVRAAPGEPPSITLTTDSVDAMGDRVIQAGVTVRDPLPILFAHRYDELPVGQATAAMIRRGAHATRVQWTWLEGDERAQRVRNAFEQNMLGASIGMRVLDQRPNGSGGYDLLKVEAIEASLTPVPANPDCIRLLKSLGWSAEPGIVLELVEDDVPCLDLMGGPLVISRRSDLFDVDLAVVRAAAKEAIREGFKDMVKDVTTREVQAAMTAITGRLYP